MTSTSIPRRIRALASSCLLLSGLLVGPAAWAADEAFRLWVDPLDIAVLSTDVDTESAKFQEYRDMSGGFLINRLAVFGESADGDRTMAIRLSKVGRRDARYTLDYGVAGRYGLTVDYNKIQHRFINNGTFIHDRTAPGVYQIADSLQGFIQGAIEDQRDSGGAVDFDFLRTLIDPIVAASETVDLGLQRDRTRAVFDLGKMGRMAWAVEYFHENRSGTRPYGGAFGFSNVIEIFEPVDYDTDTAELRGEWNGSKGGLRFGYRYSTFQNNTSTLIWDNPFRVENSTDSRAYLAPGSGSINGSSVGFADLAPDNEAGMLFLSGRAKAGGWWFSGDFGYNTMTQDEALLPYTLNSAIEGIHPESGVIFDPTLVSSLPVGAADNEVDVMNLSANAGTEFGEDWSLTFRYRYYDYDNSSARVELPGYVRFHAVWEEVPRITVPYSYTRENVSAELGWQVTGSTRLGLSYELESWDRTFRETGSTDEDLIKLTLDSRPTQSMSVRASWETGDRSYDRYETEAQELSFLEPEGINNQPGLRKFSQANREFDDYDLNFQFFPAGSWNLSLGISGREEDYPDSEFGLLGDDIFSYNGELSYNPGANLNFYLFGHLADRQVSQAARQSGGTLSTSPDDTWTLKLDETTTTFGVGLTAEGGPWTWDASLRWSESDGEADFFTTPAGSPSEAVDFNNYEDIELLAFHLDADYAISESTAIGITYLYEDYTINSFILQGLQPYLTASLLLAGNEGDYQAHVIGGRVKFRF